MADTPAPPSPHPPTSPPSALPASPPSSPPNLPSTPTPRVLPAGFVVCDACDEAVPKTLVAQHESTLCSQALSDCLLSREQHDLCHLHPALSSSPPTDNGEEEEEPELTREEVAKHIERSSGVHVLYLMDVVERLQSSVASLSSELREERRLRLEMEGQITAVIKALAEKVDHAQVAHFTAPSAYHQHHSSPSYIPSTLRTSSGRVIQRRVDPPDPFATLRASLDAASPAPPSAPLLTPSPSAWQAKRPSPSSPPSSSPEIPSDPVALTKRIHSTLNKLTPTTFDRLSQHLLLLLQSVTDPTLLSQLTTHIFDKALADIYFGRTYAQLCHVLSVGVKEGPGGKGFRYYLLNKCQEEFMKGTQHVKRKKEEVKEEKEGEEAGGKRPEEKISNEGREGEEQKQSGAEGEGVDDGGDVGRKVVESAEAASKRRMIANVRFIGELFLCDEVPAPIMLACISQLLAQVQLESSEQSEDSIQGLCKLLTTVGAKLDAASPTALAPVWHAVRAEVLVDGKHSNRGKFALMDMLEAREKGWKEREGQKGQSASGGKIEGGGGGGGAGGMGSAPTIRVGFGGVEYEGGRRGEHSRGGGEGRHGERDRERVVERAVERERDRELIPHHTAGERLQQASAMASSVTKWQPGVKKKVALTPAA